MARQNWTDEAGETTLIDDYARETTSFIEAMEDGKIEQSELDKHEAKLVALMKKVEPSLSDQQHADMTELLCEMSAYSVMQMTFMMAQAQEKEGIHRLRL